MKVHHLSHIDLDGYGAQFVARKCFSNINFYNANYGREVNSRLFEILSKVRSEQEKESLILITDLSLSLDEAQMLQSEVAAINRGEGTKGEKKVQLLLLDHHISGQMVAKKMSWYHLESKHCATKITLQKLREYFNLSVDSDLEQFVEMINSVDTWDESGFAFNFGKVAMNMIASTREFSRFMFDDFDRGFKFALLEEAIKHLLIDGRLREYCEVSLDNDIFFMKKRLLNGDVQRETMDFILARKQSELLKEHMDEYTVYYRPSKKDRYYDKKGILTYMVGGVSVLANLFLKENPEFKFFIDLSNRGGLSLRSNGDFDVAALSADLFNGGGHKSAAGGKIERFRETFLYSEAKSQIEEILGTNGEDG